MTVKITRTPVNYTNHEIKQLEKQFYSVNGNTATLKLRVKDYVKKLLELENNILTIQITKQEKSIDNGFGDLFKNIIFIYEIPLLVSRTETKRLSAQMWAVKFHLKHHFEIFSFEGAVK